MSKDTWHIEVVVMPKPLSNPAGVIEIDPAFLGTHSTSMGSALVEAQA